MKNPGESLNLNNMVKTVLKTLVRIMIRNEVSHAQFSELARQAYVESAYEHFTLPKRKMTFARVSVLTGLSRKEVVRLKKLTQSESVSAPLAVKPNRAARVITGWLQDTDFTTSDGIPKVLPLRDADYSFTTLVQRYSGDISMGAILDELTRLNITSTSTQDDTITLKSDGYIPQVDAIEKIDILLRATDTLMRTGIHNLEHTSNKARFQRQFAYRDVPPHIAKKFQQYSKEKSHELLLEFDRWLDQETDLAAQSTKTQKKSTHESSNIKVGIGIYYYEDHNNE